MIGFGDRRMTAIKIPRTIPMTIARTVSSIVATRPRNTRGSNRYWPTRCQPKFLLVAKARTSDAAITSTITAATHRQG